MLHPTPQYPPPLDSLCLSPSSSSPFPTSTPSTSTVPTGQAHLQTYVVFGGGTGANAIIGAVQGVKTTFIVPVSDDGGSSSEIQRVLGGPALGDIRSRLIRLIPASPPDSPLDCIKRLLEYRLPGGKVSSREVKAEWQEIVEGSHRLWRGIPGDRKETIRAFLVHFQSAVLKKAQRGFNFRLASIGNLFLSGSSLFLGSVPSAIFLFASLTSISHTAVSVLPCINTSASVTIAAELEDGRIIAGQSEISHPSEASLFAMSVAPGAPGDALGGQSAVNGAGGRGAGLLALPEVFRGPTGTWAGGTSSGSTGFFPLTRATTPSFPDPPVLGAEEDDDLSAAVALTRSPSLSAAPSPNPNSHHATAPMSSAAASKKAGAGGSTNLEFSKNVEEVPPLPSRIRRVFYLNAYGSEIFPRPNGGMVEALQKATCLIYAPGSLYTSILPCLELRPVGRLISRPSASSSPPSSTSSSTSSPSSPPPLQYKILLLNTRHDRETPSYSCADFIAAIVEACERSSVEAGAGAEGAEEVEVNPWEVVSHVVWMEGGDVGVEEGNLRNLGIVPVQCRSTSNGLFDEEVVKEALERIFSGVAK